MKSPIARRGTENGSGLGTQRWVVERAFAHLHWFRRLQIRWKIRDDIHEAFLVLACALICWRRLLNSLTTAEPSAPSPGANAAGELQSSRPAGRAALSP